MELYSCCSSFHKLLVSTVWCHHFLPNCKSITVIEEDCLTTSELDSPKTSLLHLSQSLSYPSELCHLTQKKPISKKSSILSLSLLFDHDGLMRVGGRLGHADMLFLTKHPIILCSHSPIIKLLVLQVHLDSANTGIGIMLAILAVTTTTKVPPETDQSIMCGVSEGIHLLCCPADGTTPS